MSGKVVTKIRIVKCPKCRNLLPEPQGYDVYKCGGCGTDLKAKKQSMAVNSDSSIQEINAAPGSTSDLVSGGKQRSGRKHQVPLRKDILKDKATASSECYLDGNGEDSGGQLIPFKFTDEEELEGELDIPKLSLRRRRVSNKGGSNKITHCEIEEISSNGDFSLERSKDESIYSSDDDGDDDRSVLIGDRPEMEIAESNLQRAEELNEGNLSLEGANDELISGSDEEDANKEKSVTAGENPEVEIIGSGLEGAEDMNNGNLPLEEVNSGIDGEDFNNDKSALVGENLVGENLPLEGAAIEGAKSEIDTTEGTTTKNPNTENVDTLGTRDHSSELSAVLGKGKLSKSATTGSSYAYDDGLSSHDGMNEHYPVKHLDSLKTTDTVDEGRNKKGKGLANSSLYGDLGTQHQSHMPHDKNHDMKESRRNQIKVLDNTTHGNSRLMKTKRDHEFPSRIPFQRSGYQSHNESGRPRNGVHDQSSSFLLRDSRADTDQEKMKLLRMIHKLQDQLDQSRVSEETNRRLSKGVSYKGNHGHAYQYHSHDLHEGRFSHALDHARCNGRCNHGIISHQRHQYSRIPYSAEVTSCAHRVDHCCYHCCSHVSADLSPRVHFQHDNLYRSYQGQDHCSSSPRHFTASKLPLYGSETNSDDQSYRATAVRKYLREKQNLAKRHHRPIAGGAPFITCHKCSNLLQLPADFLLYKRVCHKLKCGECSEVLKFSLKNGSHVVPFSSNTIGLPSRELHHQSEVISSNNLPSKTRVNYYHYSPAKPISYYDDHGLSVSQSFSSEVDPVFLPQQFHSLNGGEYVNPNVSPSSTVKAKIVASRYFSTIAAPTETDESTEFSSNMSETRKLSAEKEARSSLKNTLHKLMGYSTPSKLIRGTSSRSSYSIQEMI
ncbi:hypothetical protein L195_g026462 [Trifolium pratense]|uniref:Uncharacterized protein n=2 Tax=Trifolium pratense TaxID=57577 RepID=A0A2K3NJG5_TRIPR|nr:hypothetical protein L195_g022870 [Trifolium pratense]PNY03139.1 hypothetical protein L195_g026462 [Trifolium pratense]